MAFVQGITIAAIGLLVWHLALWPAVLMRIGRRPAPRRHPSMPLADLPRLAVLVPAHDEAATIGAKIANTAALDYPADRLRMILVLDGCTDGTADVARAALFGLARPAFATRMIELARNRGKVAALNLGLAEIDEDEIVIVTDCSAELAPDAARRLVSAFDDPGLGAIGAGYAVPETGDLAEHRLWRKLTLLKAAEARLALPMGLHGACYAARARALEPLAPDTINDDFALPMRMALAGWRIAYDPSIGVVERDGSDAVLDFRRRRRIGAGNLQQTLRHLALADPRKPLRALVFLSGKGLRPLVGPALAVSLLGSAALGLSGAPVFALLAAGQGALYLAVVLAAIWPDFRRAAPLLALRHLVVAQAASTLGALAYLAGRYRRPWARVQTARQIEG